MRIQLRNDSAANWTAANSVLAVGEVGIENDTGRSKHGDGITAWNDLAYANQVTVVSTLPDAPDPNLVYITTD